MYYIKKSTARLYHPSKSFTRVLPNSAIFHFVDCTYVYVYSPLYIPFLWWWEIKGKKTEKKTCTYIHKYTVLSVRRHSSFGGHLAGYTSSTYVLSIKLTAVWYGAEKKHKVFTDILAERYASYHTDNVCQPYTHLYIPVLWRREVNLNPIFP